MEKEVVKHHHHNHHLHPHNSINTGSSSSSSLRETDFVLKWGSRKRLRCMKIQVKDSTTSPTLRTTARVDRRVVRSDSNNNNGNGPSGGGYHSSTAPFNLRHRPSSPAQRVLRNSESGGAAMKGNQNYNNNQTNGVRGLASPERKPGVGGGGGENNVNNITAAAGSPEKGGSSSGGAGGEDVVVWPPKFMIALTNKEKEEDFMAIKGSKLPQRPKKRAKFVQRTLNLVSPGGWLCDLTLERYEVREKKITKKRPRGLKAMGSYVDSDSE